MTWCRLLTRDRYQFICIIPSIRSIDEIIIWLKNIFKYYYLPQLAVYDLRVYPPLPQICRRQSFTSMFASMLFPPMFTIVFCREPEFDTLQLHAGHYPDIATNARAPPIYASTGFTFKSSQVQLQLSCSHNLRLRYFQHGAELFSFKAAGNVYSR